MAGWISGPGRDTLVGTSTPKTKPTTHTGTPANFRVAPGPNGYLTFAGVGPGRQDSFSVLCGDTPPTITGGYANWQTIPRPLLRGVTVFQGYDPVTMHVAVRFGSWNGDGWQTDDSTGRAIEMDIERLEWMAGANFVAGPSPYVYAHSFGALGGTTPLIPLSYQQTAAVSGNQNDPRLWPWVISGGINWGTAIRNHSGYRIWQEADFTLTNYQGYSKPPQKTSAGGYFTARTGRNTPLLIAEAPTAHALYPETLAQQIVSNPKNKGLKLRHIRQVIKPGKRVWIPAHTT